MPSRKKIFTASILLITVLAFLLFGAFFAQKHMAQRALFRADLQRFSQESYDSVFLSMHSPSGYSPEMFSHYMALDTLVSSYEMQSAEELRRYLEKTFSSGNTISHIFLVLDPDMIRDACGGDGSRWEAALNDSLFSFAADHPDIAFKILLPHPSLNYWLNMDQAAAENILDSYGDFIERAWEYQNITTFYIGGEDWLLVNPDNYVSDFDVNDIVTGKIFLMCFCDNMYQATPINGQILFDMLREVVAAERTAPAVYPNLSDLCLVFFGDSLMAYGEGSLTTPGYIAGLSDAAVYNYAVGGTQAGDFPDAMSRFLSEECVREEDGTYRFSPDGADVSDKQLCIFLLYGANDYFSGVAVENPDDPYDAETYAGSLRSSLQQYMPLFPDAKFVIMTPNYTSYFSSGTEPQGDIGGVLVDYVDAAASVAKESGIYSMDNYRGLGIDESNVSDYTADGCHPNERGRLLMARHMIDFIENL